METRQREGFGRPINEEELKKLAIRLIAYAKTAAYGYGWPSRPDGSLYGGKMAEDYAFDAIAEYYEDESQYDPGRGPLLVHLKWQIRSRMANDTKLHDNQLVERCDAMDEESAVAMAESMDDPITEIDAKDFRNMVKDAVGNDTLLLEMFDGIVVGYTRGDLIEVLGLDEKSFDNAKKRLNRIVKRLTLSQYGEVQE